MRKDPETGDSWKLSPLGGLQEACRSPARAGAGREEAAASRP